MVRVSFAMLLLLFLPACATEQTPPQSAAAAADVQDANTTGQKENLLACTGLPLGGQKCGLALPKL